MCLLSPRGVAAAYLFGEFATDADEAPRPARRGAARGRKRDRRLITLYDDLRWEPSTSRTYMPGWGDAAEERDVLLLRLSNELEITGPRRVVCEMQTPSRRHSLVLALSVDIARS